MSVGGDGKAMLKAIATKRSVTNPPLKAIENKPLRTFAYLCAPLRLTTDIVAT
ncbi:hypothetical protein NWP22_03865 [Anabaenopsis tanganyikae CS-531]|uniref:Uncharacterized protein n=1 Tax=Anabaenopsis tanganyikae CS-531 TaxID=2785304 RepID=A0ABT6KCD0_9CYAN|nr:hypothetical protein [Anabaenopsis tanganyikae]MDH6105014.1 hypothetical protein [Anabaenopsis tanganyikae CS-531]